MASKGQKFNKYDLEFKYQVLEEYKKGYSSQYLAKKYNVPANTIKTWKRIQNNRGALGVAKKGRPSNKKQKDFKERYEILKKYQDFLAKQEQKKR